MKLRKRATGVLGAAAAVCVLAAACSPHAPPPVAPPPSPVARATPPETALERQTRLDFEAAEKSYRAFNAEYDRVAQAGGTDQATRVMRDHAAGPYLKSMVGFLSQAKDAGIRQRGRMRIAYVRQQGYTPTKLNIATCEDGTRVSSLSKRNEVVGKGVAVEVDIELRLVDGKWKLWDGDDEEVAKCAA